MVDLSKLQFGAPAAERDMLYGLDDYFVESDAFRLVNSGQRAIVLGNRGAGKSAIFKIVARHRKKAGDIVIELAPENYSYEMLSSTMAAEREGAWAKSGAYAASWKFLLLLMVLRALSKKSGRARSRDEKRMHAYLRDNYPDVSRNPFDAFISYLKRLEGVKIGKYEAAVKTRELQKLYKLEELDPYIPLIDQLCQRIGVTILIDELDQGWDSSEDAKAFVTGLFQACTSLNALSPRLNVVISLRHELFNNIPELYDYEQKYRDQFEVLTWRTPGMYELLAMRIRHFVPELKGASNDECWKAVFAEPKRAFRFMIERSSYRPREIITLATLALEYTRKNGRPMPISERALYNVELDYSADRAKDIASEYRFQYPGLMSVFESFRQKPAQWDREALEYHFTELSLGDRNVDLEARPWVLSAEPSFLIDILWETSFLQAGGRQGSRVRQGGDWLPGTHQDLNISLHSVNEFSIHPMFRSFLQIRS
jgi:hypothetical protein